MVVGNGGVVFDSEAMADADAGSSVRWSAAAGAPVGKKGASRKSRRSAPPALEAVARRLNRSPLSSRAIPGDIPASGASRTGTNAFLDTSKPAPCQGLSERNGDRGCQYFASSRRAA